MSDGKKCGTCAKILTAAGRTADRAHDIATSDNFKTAAVLGVGFGLAFFVTGAIVGRVANNNG